MKKLLSVLAAVIAAGMTFTAFSCSDDNSSSDDAKAFIVWEAVDDAVSYNIGIAGNTSKITYKNTGSADNYYEWSGLEDGEEYTFSIYATLSDGTNTKTNAVTRTVCAEKGGRCLRVMGYFRDSGSTLEEQSLHLAITTDGLHWQSLNGNTGVFQLSTIGGNRVRDPYIVKKPDGKYLMIATDWTTYLSPSSPGNHRLYDDTKSDVSDWDYVTNNYWNVNTTCLIFADSDDMTEWTNERQIQMVSDKEKTAFKAAYGNYQFCWAPEIIHNNGEVIFTDPETEETYTYGVIWSGSGETNGTTSKSYNPKKNKYETTSGRNFNYRRTFVNYTNNFETFTDAQVYFEPTPNGTANSNIDASVCTDDKGKFYIFFKDEKSGYWGMGENYSTSLLPNSFNANCIWGRGWNGKQVQEAAGGTYNQGEGMFCFRPNAGVDKWYCVLDAHDAHQSKVFATFETTDFMTWKENDKTSWPEGDIRHGACVEVTLDEMLKLIDYYGF